jgi:hypothetical protein
MKMLVNFNFVAEFNIVFSAYSTRRIPVLWSRVFLSGSGGSSFGAGSYPTPNTVQYIASQLSKKVYGEHKDRDLFVYCVLFELLL